MMTPRWMKLSIGLISVCGQFAKRPACSLRRPGFRGALIPLGAALGLEGEGFDGSNSVDRLDHSRALQAFCHRKLADDPGAARAGIGG